MIVADIMTPNPMTVQQMTTLADAVRIMLAHHISGLPVLDQSGHLVGIVTEGDLLRRPELGTAGNTRPWLVAFLAPGKSATDYAHTHGRHVADVMTSSVLTVTPQTDLAEVAELMRRKHLKRLPVLDDGKLVGIVSRADLVGALALKLIETDSEKPTPGLIRDYILKTMASEPWAPKAGIKIDVIGDVVDLSGVVFSDAERHALKVIAENAPGVKEVHDHLVYVDPGSGMAFPASGSAYGGI